MTREGRAAEYEQRIADGVTSGKTAVSARKLAMQAMGYKSLAIELRLHHQAVSYGHAMRRHEYNRQWQARYRALKRAAKAAAAEGGAISSHRH